MENYGILSLVPILLTLFIAFYKKNVFLALISGIIFSTCMIGIRTGDFLTGIESIANVFTDPETTMTTFFVLMTGSIMCVVSRSGGVEGLVRYCTEKKAIVKGPVASQLISFVLGLLLFVDGTSSIAITALVGKPFFRRYKVPAERLALISNSTGAAVAWIVPFGSACAVLTTFFTPVAKDLGLTGNPFTTVMSSVVFQFYTIALLLLVFISIIKNINLGAMKDAESSAENMDTDFEYETSEGAKGKERALNMLLPIVFMVAMIFGLLLYTGKGSLSSGDGGVAVFVSGIITLILSGVLYISQGITKADSYVAWCLDGMRNMFDLVVILVLAYAFGSLISTLGTAVYLSQYAKFMPAQIMLVCGYIIASAIAYSTGSSGATAAIMTPVLVPVLFHVGISPVYSLGAIISGAVFGDLNSPISDSVILTSSMTGVPIMTHVKTQLPYTMIAWTCAFAGYLVLGFIG